MLSLETSVESTFFVAEAQDSTCLMLECLSGAEPILKQALESKYFRNLVETPVEA